MPQRVRASVFLLALMACSCGENTPAPATPTPPPAPVAAPSVSSVTVSGTAPSVGATSPFSATANLSNGTAQTVTSQATWSSSNTSVATVTNAGVVTGIGAGEADITATYQGASGRSHVAVNVVRATFTVSGLVTDGASGGVLPNINVQTVDSANTTKSTLTDSTGNFTVSGVSAGPLTLTASAVSYQTTIKTVVTVASDIRVDIVLTRAAPSYAGVWTGQYRITDCQDINPPGLIVLNLCSQLIRGLTYRFTLSQSGASVTGTYNLTSPMFSCPCGGDYGTFDMSGTMALDGTLAISATGAPKATGLRAAMTFNVRQATSSSLAGTLSGELTFGGIQRATFSGAIQ